MNRMNMKQAQASRGGVVSAAGPVASRPAGRVVKQIVPRDARGSSSQQAGSNAASGRTQVVVKAVEAPPAPASPARTVSNDKPTVVITGASSGLGLHAAKSERPAAHFGSLNLML